MLRFVGLRRCVCGGGVLVENIIFAHWNASPDNFGCQYHTHQVISILIVNMLRKPFEVTTDLERQGTLAVDSKGQKVPTELWASTTVRPQVPKSQGQGLPSLENLLLSYL